jgi:lipopolysaccharide/colanic/teichoic acid biosynthesis glycosyltransferase
MNAYPPVSRVSTARRACDLVVSGLALVVAAPLLAVAALAILVTDGRPVFFHQVRVGEGGHPFRLCKLRSMRTGPAGPGVTAGRDARITRVGAVLRRTSVDELPQLWHVLRGRMTLVGPRPESVELAERYPAQCRPVLMARPGLTGPAQLRYREASAVPPDPATDVETWYLTTMVPLRTAADLEYLARPSLAETVRYLALTALFVVGLVDLQERTTTERRVVPVPAPAPAPAASAGGVRH